MKFDDKMYRQWRDAINRATSENQKFWVFGKKDVVITNGHLIQSFLAEELHVSGYEQLRRTQNKNIPPDEASVLAWEVRMFKDRTKDIPIKDFREITSRGKQAMAFHTMDGRTYHYSPYYMEALQVLEPLEWMLIPSAINDMMLLVGVSDRPVGVIAPMKIDGDSTRTANEAGRGPVPDEPVHATPHEDLPRKRSPRTTGKRDGSQPVRRSPRTHQ
jgi:hypothetical protein